MKYCGEWLQKVRSCAGFIWRRLNELFTLSNSPDVLYKSAILLSDCRTSILDLAGVVSAKGKSDNYVRDPVNPVCCRGRVWKWLRGR